MRISVAPSSIATSKSCDIPMESTGSNSLPNCARTRRAIHADGGNTDAPFRDRQNKAERPSARAIPDEADGNIASTRRGNSSSLTPDFAGSGSSFTSISTRSRASAASSCSSPSLALCALVFSVLKSFFARSSRSAKRHAIHRIDAVKQPHRPRDLVALQMPDHVPRRVQIRKLSALRLPFLHAILAEMAHACFVQLPDLRGRMRFRYGDQRDFFRAASRARSRALDALANPRKIFRYFAESNLIAQILACVSPILRHSFTAWVAEGF